MSQDDGYTGQNEIQVFRGRVDSLTIYEITETELDALERGSPYSIYLNFGIFLLTLGMSFLTSLLSVDVQSLLVLTAFLVLTVVGILGGTFLIILWHRSRRDVTDVVSRIRTRITGMEESSGPHDSSTDDGGTDR